MTARWQITLQQDTHWMELINRPSNTSDMILEESSDELSSAAVIKDTTNACMQS